MSTRPYRDLTAPPAALFSTRSAAAALDRSPVSFSQIIDGTWLHWTVVEVDARMLPGSHGARCLIFMRQDCMRRVWDFPSEWRALDATALEALSWHR
jgi:hypothetical protein